MKDREVDVASIFIILFSYIYISLDFNFIFKLSFF